MGGLQANATSLTSRDLSLRVPALHSPTRGEPRGGITTLAHYFLKFNSEAASPVQAQRRSAHDFLQTSGGKFEHCPGPCQTAVCRGTWAVAAIRLTVTLRLSSTLSAGKTHDSPARLHACVRILFGLFLRGTLGRSAWQLEVFDNPCGPSQLLLVASWQACLHHLSSVLHRRLLGLQCLCR